MWILKLCLIYRSQIISNEEMGKYSGFSYFPVDIIPPALHADLFVYHQRYIILAIKGIIK
jgi:hypothetical protein